MQNTEKWSIEILGVRGSMVVTLPEMQRYGGDTVCVRVQIGDKVLFLDAGTGIMYADTAEENHVLIGHPHLDHVLGLCKWDLLADAGKKVHIYMKDQDGLDARRILNRLIGLPFWPINLEQLPAKVQYHKIEGAFFIGNVKVDILAGNHPGGVTHFRLSDGEKSLVYAVDCELTEDAATDLIAFSKDCDLFICDGQLTDGELETKKGWGHSSMRQAAAVGKASGAKQTILVHFDPYATDEQLELLEKELREEFPNCVLGKQGEKRYL